MDSTPAAIDADAWSKSYFAKWPLRDLIAIQYAARSQAGFKFLADILDPQFFIYHEAVSAPVSRQMYILISHNFELLLDAAVCMCSHKTTEFELEREVKVSHNLSTLWGRVTNKEVRKLVGIIRIKPPKEKDYFQNFEVHFSNGKIVSIPEFVNVRYDVTDFRGKEKTVLRKAQKEEVSMNTAIDAFTKAANEICAVLYARNK